jgi:hypothetical protein
MTAAACPARRRATRALALVLLVPAFALGLAGSAFGDRAQVTTVLGALANSGPTPTVTLPPGGSAVPLTDGVATVALPGLLNTGIITVSTQGTVGPTGSVQSSAQVAGLTVGPEALPALAANAWPTSSAPPAPPRSPACACSASRPWWTPPRTPR